MSSINFKVVSKTKREETSKTSSVIYSNRTKSEMEAQGNILKTLLIAAVVYTLALGAPVKRDTSISTVTSNTVISNVTEACAAATLTRHLTTCSNTTWNVTTVVNGGSYDENYAAEILWIKLQEKNFKGAVCEAV